MKVHKLKSADRFYEVHKGDNWWTAKHDRVAGWVIFSAAGRQLTPSSSKFKAIAKAVEEFEGVTRQGQIEEPTTEATPSAQHGTQES